MCFLVTFCTTQKVTIRSLCREHRGSANLESAHPNNTLPRTKLNPFETFRGSANLDSARHNGGFAQTKLKPSQREIRGFANLESAHPNNNFTRTKLNPFAALGGIFLLLPQHFCRFAAFPPPLAALFVAAATFFRLAAVSLPGRHTPCAKAQRGFANLDYTLPSGSVKRLFLTVIRQYTSCTSA